jgi:hypothetical protein
LKGKNLSLANETGRLGDLFGSYVVESAKFVLDSPAAPISIDAAVLLKKLDVDFWGAHVGGFLIDRGQFPVQV